MKGNKPMAVNPVTVPTPQNGNMDRAMFVWVGTIGSADDPLSTDAKQQTLLNFCAANGINVLFLDMWRYLGGANWSAANAAVYKKFIAVAHASGIRVYALCGNSDWPVNQAWVMQNIVKAIAQFNVLADAVSTTYENGSFDGVMFDIEYWAEPGYSAQANIPGFCDLIAATRKVLDKSVGCFTSQWMADPVGAQSAVYKGETKLEGEHLMDASDFVCVGCYSNNDGGPDGAAQVAMFQRWFDYAKVEGRAYGLWCGSETIGPASGLTYFGQTKTHMEASHAVISAAFKVASNAVFRGQAVHCYSSYSGMSA